MWIGTAPGRIVDSATAPAPLSGRVPGVPSCLPRERCTPITTWAATPRRCQSARSPAPARGRVRSCCPRSWVVRGPAAHQPGVPYEARLTSGPSSRRTTRARSAAHDRRSRRSRASCSPLRHSDPMRQDETWHRLREWTYRQTPSERLAAHVLLAEGYTGLDPVIRWAAETVVLTRWRGETEAMGDGRLLPARPAGARHDHRQVQR